MSNVPVPQNGEIMPAESGHQPPAANVAVEQSRAMTEVQASMVMAKQFPRHETAAMSAIINECQRRRLAESAIYSYPRGGTRIQGPSIRLAEVLAQKWGNIDAGIIELTRARGYSEMMAYAWDLETNTRITRTFQVPHVRYSKQHGNTDLSGGDPRDIYELTANQGSRRLRACILAVIPGHVVDKAMEQIDQTLAGASDEPLADRALKIVEAFKTYGVDTGMIEERLGHNLQALSGSELVDLRKIYNSLRDGMSKRDDWFDVTGSATKDQAEKLKQDLKAKQESAKPKAGGKKKTDGSLPLDGASDES